MSGIIGQVGARSGVIGTTELAYEEGNHVVVVTSSGGSAPSIHASANTLKYVRIGNLCHVQGLLYITSVSGASGRIQFSLPFVGITDTNGNGYARSHITTYNVDYGGDSCAGELIGSASMNTRSQVDAGAWTDLCVTGYYGINFSYSIV